MTNDFCTVFINFWFKIPVMKIPLLHCLKQKQFFWRNFIKNWMIQITPKTSLCRKTDFSLDSQFIFPPPHSGFLGNKYFYMSRIIKILSSYANKSSWHVLIRSCQDLIKVFQETLSIKILARCVKFCTSWQDLAWHGKVYQVSFHWVLAKRKHASKIRLFKLNTYKLNFFNSLLFNEINVLIFFLDCFFLSLVDIDSIILFPVF